MLNAKEIKDKLTLDHIIQILEDLGAEPRQSSNLNEIWCRTICHNGNSHKLYLYKDYYGIFDKLHIINKKKYRLNEAVKVGWKN